MEELISVKLCVGENGILYAILPNKEVKPLLVDVHDLSHYGVLRIERQEGDANKHRI